MEIVDYAMPLMNIERMAKQVHELCLENNYEAAEELTLKLGVEARVLSATLALMQNKDTIKRTRTGEIQREGKQADHRQVV
jgi:hypothetical protein